MFRNGLTVIFALGFVLCAREGASQTAQSPLGLFESHRDIGATQKPGSAAFDPAQGAYRVTGGGANMWSTNDALHFVWKRASGNLSLAADVQWIGSGGNAHRKACVLIRQSLDADSAYADAVVHGDGLTSLQYREEQGGPTREIQSNTSMPRRIRIEKQGDYVSMSIGQRGEALRPAGGSFKIKLTEPFFVGLGVCAHDNNAAETVVFSKVELAVLDGVPASRAVIESTLETVVIASKDRRVTHHTRDPIEAPNWTRDGTTLLFNSRGRIYRLPAAGGEPVLVDTGFAIGCTSQHAISPDGLQLAITDSSEARKPFLYVLPIQGGVLKRVTLLGPSSGHSWSPDGRKLLFSGERNGEFGIFTIPATGGEETRLIPSRVLNDNPEYSSDGKTIYFNSDHAGLTQIWRMNADGSDPKPLIADAFNNWLPHPSPDGRWLAFLSCEKDVNGLPENRDVVLRLLPMNGGEIQVLAKLLGGRGTIDAPSWAPDSRRLAFVSYRLALHP